MWVKHPIANQATSARLISKRENEPYLKGEFLGERIQGIHPPRFPSGVLVLSDSRNQQHKFEQWEINPPTDGFRCSYLSCRVVYIEGDWEGFYALEPNGEVLAG